MDSSRPRDRSTRVSSAVMDSGRPASASAVSAARTWYSGGNASEAKYAQMSRSSRPGSRITSALATARPARPIC